MPFEESQDPTRLFSLEEANRLIPTVRRLIHQIVDAQTELGDMQPDIRRAREKAQLGGGSHLGTRYLRRLDVLRRAVEKIEDLGVLVKDYRLGLCDFPHLRDGRIVYLCWKLGEDEIRWWHDIEAGYAGRQPL